MPVLARPLTLAAAAAATAAVAASTAGANATHAVATVGPCRNMQLAVVMRHIPGSEGAGSTGYRLILRNTSRRRCWVHEHLGLQLLGARSVKLPTHVIDVGRHGVAVISPAGTVSTRLRFSPDIPGPGEPGRGPCEPQARKVIAFLGPPRGGGVTGWVKPPTSVCEHGRIEEQALL